MISNPIQILLIVGIWLGFAAYVPWKFHGHERRSYLKQHRTWILVTGLFSLGTLRGIAPENQVGKILEIVGIVILAVFLWFQWFTKRDRNKEKQVIDSY